MRRQILLAYTHAGFHALLFALLCAGMTVLGWLSQWAILYGLAAGLGAAYGGWWLRRWIRLERALRSPLPQTWRAVLERIPLYAGMGPDERERFELLVRLFLARHRFEGVDGAIPTEERRLLVAAGAAALLFGRPYRGLPHTPTILFYPGPFDEQFRIHRRGPFLGQVHGQGPVLLSLPAVESEWFCRDGQNLVLHELAHLLDLDSHGADGIPRDLPPALVRRWRLCLGEIQEAIRKGQSPLRPYAATHPAECFAVSVEAFFEIPHTLARAHPQWYALLSEYFQLDPRRWLNAEEEVDPFWNT